MSEPGQCQYCRYLNERGWCLRQNGWARFERLRCGRENTRVGDYIGDSPKQWCDPVFDGNDRAHAHNPMSWLNRRAVR